MPDVTISLTQAQVARLSEAWSEVGVPLATSVLKALAQATKQEIRRKRQATEADAYISASEAGTSSENAEFDAW